MAYSRLGTIGSHRNYSNYFIIVFGICQRGWGCNPSTTTSKPDAFPLRTCTENVCTNKARQRVRAEITILIKLINPKPDAHAGKARQKYSQHRLEFWLCTTGLKFLIMELSAFHRQLQDEQPGKAAEKSTGKCENRCRWL